MAERIVSPGVFIREKDQSFLAAGIANLGAAVIGPTFEGPALVPTLVSSFSEYTKRFGAKLGTTAFDVTKHHYTDETVNSYFEGTGPGGSGLTVVRVLGNGGYAVSSSVLLSFTSGSTVSSSILLLPTVTGSTSFASGVSSIKFASGSETGTSTTGSNAASFVLVISGSGATKFSESVSLDKDNAISIFKMLGSSPNGSKPFYVALDFANSNDSLQALTSALSGSWSGATHTYIQSGSAFGEINSSYAFLKARTPWITNYGANKNLFKFFTISDGNSTNSKFKIQIANIKYSSAEEKYRFDVVVKDLNKDTDAIPTELERFSGVSCDPNDTKFIARMIGDIYYTFNSSNDKIENGTFPNKSPYIYVKMNTDSGTGEYVATETDYPWGFGVALAPLNGYPKPIDYITTNTVNSSTDDKVYFGWSYSGSSDNNVWLSSPVATATSATSLVEGTQTFQLTGQTADSTAISSADLTSTSRTKWLKFSVPMQGGYDGESPYLNKKIGTNIDSGNYYGFNLASSTSVGTSIYKAAINTLSNPDEIDINLVVLPGIIHDLHSNVTNYLITKIEDRADCFAIIDPEQLSASVSEAISAIASLDTSYAAVYYPWVKMGLRFVPPSVAVLGAYSQSDRLGAEWFAPAGLNRGGLASFGVTNVYKILKHSDRDDLYEARVNPIARFASQASTPQVVVFGQKTLQSKPSALDRVNVRRLIINLKKFIASSTKFLVFEQNTSATRQRFLNMVNPYMESVQQRSGLTSFKIVMDDSNNTAEVIDRNQLVGQIYIQPTRTAEFIVLDFVVLPTGAAFPTS